MTKITTVPDIASNKADSLYEFLLYGIATGKWQPGEKLLSVREAETLWGVHRLTILTVYRRLEASGLLESKGRTGFLVKQSPSQLRLVRHHDQLDDLYKKISRLIEKETDLLPGEVMQYFANMAKLKARDEPEVAFVECSHHQATCHASEITEKLGIPVWPMDVETYLSETGTKAGFVITTGFHIAEVLARAEKRKQPVHSLAIEYAPHQSDLEDIGESEVALVSLPDRVYDHIYDDVAASCGDIPLQKQEVTDLDAGLEVLLAQPENKNTLFLLAPYLWGTASEQLKEDKRVREIRFRIVEQAWEGIRSVLPVPVVNPE